MGTGGIPALLFSLFMPNIFLSKTEAGAGDNGEQKTHKAKKEPTPNKDIGKGYYNKLGTSESRIGSDFTFPPEIP